jgi:hypothetical protein
MRFYSAVSMVFIFVLFGIFSLHAAPGTLRGFITDSTNGEAVAYANIIIKGLQKGAPSDTRGYYFIPKIPAGKHTVIVSIVGYQKKEVPVEIVADELTQLDIKLIPTSVELTGLSIYGKKGARENETDLGLQKISIREIQMRPSGIESDIFRALKTTPGVSSTGDVTSRYYVRGGGSDQNLILLNGAVVYNPYHALGIFSVIDPEMISMMEFYKGGFAPEYGARLSSILNLVTKDGNKNEYHATASGSFLAGKVAVEGPIPDGSFIVTGRKSYYADALKKFLHNNDAPFDFYDLSAKVNYSNQNFLKNSKFTVHTFISNDQMKNDDPLKEDYEVKNNIYGVNWYQVWGSPLFSTISLSYSGFEAEIFPKLSSSKPRRNKLSDISSNWNFTYLYQSKDELNFGLQNTYLKSDLIMENLYGQKDNFSMKGGEMRGYANYKFYRYEKIGLDLGMRVNLASISQKGPFLFEPRVNFTYMPNPTLSLKAVIGRYSQEVATLSNENELISIFEPWVIFPSNLKPSEATHIIVGVQSYISDRISMELEAYYKDLTNLFDVNDKQNALGSYDYINVDGEAYGGEFSAKIQESDFFFNASYSLGWAYKYKDNAKYFPRYDVRHTVNILFDYNFGDGWIASSNWTFCTGMPFTPIAGYYNRLEINDPWGDYMSEKYKSVIYWGEKNVKRLPVYHRLDLSINKKFHLRIADVTVGASIVNVYDRKNIYYFDKDTGEKVYMLPFLPSASVKVEL